MQAFCQLGRSASRQHKHRRFTAIGTTMTIKDKIVPNLVGVDIGCGMETVIIKANMQSVKNFDPVHLDKINHSALFKINNAK